MERSFFKETQKRRFKSNIRFTMFFSRYEYGNENTE